MKPITRLALSCLAAVMIFGFLGCGEQEEELLPGDNAEEILTNLDSVEELAAEGACDEAIEAVEDVRQQVEGLPAGVSDQLRQNLMSGVGRLREVTEESCGTDVDDEKNEAEKADDADREADSGEDDGAVNRRPSGGGDDGAESGDEPSQGDDGEGRQQPDSPSREPQDETPDDRDGGTSEPEPRAPEPPASGGISPGEAESSQEGAT